MSFDKLLASLVKWLSNFESKIKAFQLEVCGENMFEDCIDDQQNQASQSCNGWFTRMPIILIFSYIKTVISYLVLIVYDR